MRCSTISIRPRPLPNSTSFTAPGIGALCATRFSFSASPATGRRSSEPPLLPARRSFGFNAEAVGERIEARNAARKAKNFAEADRIRGELEAMGVTLKDAKDPKTGELVTTWEVAR